MSAVFYIIHCHDFQHTLIIPTNLQHTWQQFSDVIKDLKGLVMCFIYHMVSYFNKNGHWFSFFVHLAHHRAYTYSGTPLFRMSETWTSRFNGWFAQARMAFPLTAIHYNPWKADIPLLAKVDRFFGPFSTLDCGNSADACLSSKVVINPTTGHYNSTGTHNTNLWSAFPPRPQ